MRVAVEKHEVLIISGGKDLVRTWCNGCQAATQMVSAERAAQMVGRTRRTIYRWVEGQKVHFTETQDGALLVCVKFSTQRMRETVTEQLTRPLSWLIKGGKHEDNI